MNSPRATLEQTTEGLPAMHRRIALTGALAVAAIALASGGALAHTGAEHARSFASGFAHPFTGLDHMLAMVAVGLWAGVVGGRALWAWPAAFVGVMVLGGGLGFAGIAAPMVEPGILASVVVLGLLVLGAFRLPVAAGAALVALFALLHGHAHGTELAAEGAAVSHFLGFALATAVLHALGLGIACVAAGDRGRLFVRGAGALVAAAGVALALV
jgi:urease accessory protein